MARMTMETPRIHWSASVAGAFLAVATATVLGLFGAAFGRAGITVLSGVWQILTPLVAGFVGAAVAVSLGGRSYLNGIMVWALSMAYAAAVLATSASVSASGRVATAPSGGVIALGGLAAILGLVGALFGSAIGGSLEPRIIRRTEEPSVRTDHPATTPEATVTAHGVRPVEPPELRH